MLAVAQAQAKTDPLTRLPNSRGMERRLGQALHARVVGVVGQTVGILLIDGDNLRAFNEISYTHETP